MISMRNEKPNREVSEDFDAKSEGQASQMSDLGEQRPEVGNLFVAGIVLAVVTCIVDVIAVAIPWWTYSTRMFFGSEIKTNSGLWSVCRETIPIIGETTHTCSHIAEPNAYTEHTRSCNTVGLVLMGLGVAISLVYRLWQTNLHLLLLIGGAMFNIAGLLTWITAVVYSVEYSKEDGHSAKQLHAACYISLAAGLTYHVVCILAVFKVDRSRASIQPQKDF